MNWLEEMEEGEEIPFSIINCTEFSVTRLKECAFPRKCYIMKELAAIVCAPHSSVVCLDPSYISQFYILLFASVVLLTGEFHSITFLLLVAPLPYISPKLPPSTSLDPPPSICPYSLVIVVGVKIG